MGARRLTSGTLEDKISAIVTGVSNDIVFAGTNLKCAYAIGSFDIFIIYRYLVKFLETKQQKELKEYGGTSL